MNIPLANRPVRCALFGLGDWAWRHVQLIRATPDFQLVAISSRSEAAWERARKEIPGVMLFRDHRELLGTIKPDLAVITTPHHLHAPMAMDAFGAGAHVLVEKPIATNMQDGRMMIRTASAAGRMLAVYHNRRFDPWLLAALKAKREEKLGPLIDLSVSWPGSAPAGTWRTRKLESGGLFFDLGAHLVDYLITLAGVKPIRVSGHVHRVPGRDPLLNEDHAVAKIQFVQGMRGRVYTSSLDLAPARRFHLIGEVGTLTDEWNWNGGSCEVRTRDAAGAITTTTYPYGSEADSAAGRTLYDNIAAHLFNGTPLVVTAEEALMNIGVLLAAEKSAGASGDWVDLGRFIAGG